MENKEIMNRIRHEFAERKRAREDLGRVFIANSVGQSLY
jgi:hypothetical protein